MGDLGLLSGWNQIEIEDGELKSSIIHFQRSMYHSPACIKEYFSHIFICKFENVEDMKVNWISINRYVAVSIQSKIEDTLEVSNFYLCCFVPEQVDVTTKMSIENDTFCAKKYIFEYEQFDLEKCCVEIEHRIFALNVETKCNNIRKIAKLELNNFRVYEGNVQIDFSTNDRLPASLVVIYAKNGVGKTSLFDGVEYALTGEVERLIDLGKTEIKGAVYHNRKRISDEAYVRIEMSDNEKIHRNVSKIQENGNDIKKMPLGKNMGKNIVYGKENQIKQLILPHHRIDTFVSGMTPVQRYKEWVQGIDDFKIQQDKFLCAYKDTKVVKKELEFIQSEITASEREEEKLISLKTEKLKIQKLIAEYNQRNKKFKLEELSDNSSVITYDKLINDSNMYCREYEKLKKNITHELENIFEIESYGILKLSQLFGPYEKIQEDIEKKKLDLEKGKKIITLRKELSENRNKQAEISYRLTNLEQILTYGVNKIIKANVYLKNSAEHINNLKKNVDYCTKRIKELEVSNVELSSSIQKIDDDKLQQEKIKKLYSIIEDQNKLKINWDTKNSLQREIIEKNNQLFKELEQLEDMILKLNALNISEQLNSLSYKDVIQISKFVDREIASNIEVLFNQYSKDTDILKAFQEKIILSKKKDKEIAQIQNVVSEYLLKHTEFCECPACHTKFSDWKSLYQRIRSVQPDDTDSLIQEETLVIEKMEKLNNEYKFLCDECDNILKKKIANCTASKEICKMMINKNVADLELVKKQLIKIKSAMEENEHRLLEMQIYINEISLEQAENWIIEYKENISKDKKIKTETMQQNNSSLQVLRTSLNNAKIEMDKVQEERRKIQDNPQLMGFVRFMLAQNSDYDLITEKENLNRELDFYINNCIELQKELNQITMTIVDVGVLNKEIEECRKQLAEIEIWKCKCKSLPNISLEGVKETKQRFQDEIARLDYNIELLYQIREENGARNYYLNYARIIAKIKKLKEKEILKGKEYNDLLVTYKESKGILEKALTEYFSQVSINDIYKKINPHTSMKNIYYELSFSDKDEPELSIKVKEDEDDKKENLDEYRPEWYFSTAQLNTVAFSSFFSKAITADNTPLNTIFVDDPIGHFDDMNVLGFADLIRSLLELGDFQLIMSTHDEKVYRILERKFCPDYYKSCFIRLPDGKGIIRK